MKMGFNQETLGGQSKITNTCLDQVGTLSVWIDELCDFFHWPNQISEKVDLSWAQENWEQRLSLQIWAVSTSTLNHGILWVQVVFLVLFFSQAASWRSLDISRPYITSVRRMLDIGQDYRCQCRTLKGAEPGRVCYGSNRIFSIRLKLWDTTKQSFNHQKPGFTYIHLGYCQGFESHYHIWVCLRLRYGPPELPLLMIMQELGGQFQRIFIRNHLIYIGMCLYIYYIFINTHINKWIYMNK